MKSNKRPWTRGEKLLFLAPVIFLVGLGASFIAPKMKAQYLGEPDYVLTVSEGTSLRQMVISSDGRFVVASALFANPVNINTSKGGEILVWNAETLKPLPAWSLKAVGNQPIYNLGVNISPNIKDMAIVSNRNLLQNYDFSSRRLNWEKALKGYISDISISFSPTGRFVALHGKGITQIFLAKNGKTISFWRNNYSLYGTSGVLVWAPNEKEVAIIGPYNRRHLLDGIVEKGQHIELRNAITGQLKRTFVGSQTSNLKFSPDGQYLIAVAPLFAYFNKKRHLWDGLRCYEVATGKVIWKYEALGFDANFIDSTFSSDGRFVAAYKESGSQIMIFDVKSGKQVKRLSIGQKVDSILNPFQPSIAFSPKDKRLFARGRNSIFVWDLDLE